MSVNSGYTFSPLTNSAGDVSAVEIMYAPDTIAYTKGWRFSGSVSLYVEPDQNNIVANATFYMSSVGSTVAFKLSEIAKINNLDPVAGDYIAVFTQLDAVMPNA